VTSPPYFGLRDYGVAGQIGLETTVEEYVNTMAEVFREVRRILRDDGTCWINWGDTYAANRSYQITDNKHCDVGNHAAMRVPNGLKPKDLIGIPWRCAFALQDDGWYLRSDIIWAKGCSGVYSGGSVMPESVTDRPTKSHEYLFLLTKSARYFYDNEAVREESTGRESWFGDCGYSANSGRNDGSSTEAKPGTGKRNRRSVWTVNPQPYSQAHFATFPPALIEPCILAGTSEKGCCSACGKPWERIIEKGLAAHDGTTQTIYPKGTTSNRLALLRQAARERGEEYSNQTKTMGWQPACPCNAPAQPCVVLDPFGGSGTTGEVAQRLGREFILIELNPDYHTFIHQRTRQSALALAT
jgi:DNA modification methylase